jgi:hypothetical protein
MRSVIIEAYVTNAVAKKLKLNQNVKVGKKQAIKRRWPVITAGLKQYTIHN